MPKTTTKFVCQQCGYESAGWLGKCPGCGSWNTLVETKFERGGAKEARVSGAARLLRLNDIEKKGLQRLSTEILELDRVLGGGVVPGSVILLAGDPGIGKSTLLLQTAAGLAQKTSPAVYISGEESAEQIKIRAERLGIKNQNILFLNETNIEQILEVLRKVLEEEGISLVVVDSIQTIWTEDLGGTAGSIGQVRESASKLINFAKIKRVPLFLVGHVTKEGGIAGPMVLSHLVDTILFFEGERFQSLRLLRGIKNRFGPTDELGVFSMEEKGLIQVENPSALFLEATEEEVSGKVVTCLMEGSRPLLVEVQALVLPTQLPVPRRVSSGIEWNRLSLLVAVLSRRAALPLSNFDIFVNVVGGIKISEPAADLAICLAIASAWSDKAINSHVCLLGEVGLLGEIRMVGQLKKRIQEAKRLGFTRVISPETVKTLNQTIKILLQAPQNSKS